MITGMVLGATIMGVSIVFGFGVGYLIAEAQRRERR